MYICYQMISSLTTEGAITQEITFTLFQHLGITQMLLSRHSPTATPLEFPPQPIAQSDPIDLAINTYHDLTYDIYGYGDKVDNDF